jgi:hypothetical protein
MKKFLDLYCGIKYGVVLMGGGAYGISPSGGQGETESIFSRALENARKTRIRNVFISFHVEDEGMVDLLRHQAKDENYDLEFRDYSVKEPFDEKWKTNCRERMAQTSALICVIGKETANRKAVNWEIEEAYRQGKKVIGVRLHRDANHKIPKPLLENNAPIINWNLKQISRELAKK